jgi:hypothetical protein
MADVIETKDGARLVGTVAGINDGKITLKTSDAGDIEVAQSEVAKLTMESALAIRLEDGTTVEGTIAPTGEGAITIDGGASRVQAPGTCHGRGRDVGRGWHRSSDHCSLT